MYEEEKKGSGAFIKDLIIKLLYMLLFLFLFMWLYPAPKVDLSDVKVKVDKSELEPLFAGIFNDNITAMKDAARAYFTVDRLPSTNGGTAKMTLQEMLNKKMLVPFVDSNGKTCDTSASYVEVTRNSTYDYNLKVYLSCSDKQDYIIETIGCTSICPGCVNAPVAASTTTTKTSGYGGGTTTIVRPSTTPTIVIPSDNNNNNSNDNNNNNNNDNETPTQKLYEYVKDVEEWNTNNTWTTTKKSNSSTVKLVDTRTRTEEESVRKTYTYRTVSWIFGQDSGESYSLYLNNIPSDARNVTVTSQSKFSSNSELRNYANNRYSCVIQMVGSGCPYRGAPDDIQNEDLYYTDVASFSYNTLRVRKQGNRWTVAINYRNNRVIDGDWAQYLAPIKFTVQWYEGDTVKVKEYKYAYKSTHKDYKYSTNNNDTSLLNNGYKLTGVVK